MNVLLEVEKNELLDELVVVSSSPEPSVGSNVSQSPSAINSLQKLNPQVLHNKASRQVALFTCFLSLPEPKARHQDVQD